MQCRNYLSIPNFKSILCVASCVAMFAVAAVSVPAQDSPAPDSAENSSAAPVPEQSANATTDPSSQGSQPTQANAPDQQNPAPKTVPATLTVPSGTLITIRMTGWLSSDQNKPGDTFRTELEDPLIAQGWVVSRQGQTVYGEVVVAQKASRDKNVSQLGLQLTRLILVDGQQLPIEAQMVQQSAPLQGRAAAIGGTPGVGAASDETAGAGGGGAAAGGRNVLLTRGGPTIVSPGRLLTFELQAPLMISTSDSVVAFRPVDQTDLTANSNAPAPSQGNGSPNPPPSAYPPAPPYPYPYPYAYDPYFYDWGYPGPFIGLGFYGGWGWGARFGGFGFRGGFRR